MITDKQIQSDVIRGLELVQSIETQEAELKAISDRLEAAALERPDEHQQLQDPNLPGRQFIAAGRLPIQFQSDLLIGSFQADSPLKDKLEAIIAPTGVSLVKFYKPVSKREMAPADAEKFRALARELLGPVAVPFLTACLARDKFQIPKSKTVICWDRVKPEA